MMCYSGSVLNEGLLFDEERSAYCRVTFKTSTSCLPIEAAGFNLDGSPPLICEINNFNYPIYTCAT